MDCASTDGKEVNRIVTASRDGSVKLWSYPNSSSNTNTSTDHTLFQLLSLSEHEGFINSVKFIAPSTHFPGGLILSGGADKLINVWDCGREQVIATLIGHEGNVCKLVDVSRTSKSGSWLFASASWDGTARIWSEELSPLSCLVLKPSGKILGPCWSVACLAADTFVTAHADKSIRMWRGEQEIKVISNAHEDVVRDIVPLRDGTEFLSVGNDGQIKIWSSEGGRVLKSIFGAHQNYIYSVARNERGDRIATGGEGGIVKIWKYEQEEFTLEEELVIPMISVWSVVFLLDDSLAVAGSGGSFFIFTNKTTIINPENDFLIQQEYQTQVDLFKMASSQQEELEKSTKDESVLLSPGQFVGQNVLVRRKESKDVEAHQWTGTEWTNLGTVVSHAAPEKQKSSHDGKFYDFIFKVELDDSGSLYELPYNAGENAFAVAKDFLERNDLPILYLDQVAQFITKNAVDQQKISRQIPESEESEKKKVKEATEISFAIDPAPYLVTAFNETGVKNKLKEFGLVDPEKEASLLDCLQNWPIDRLFPCLDWIRMLPLQKDGCSHEIIEVLLETRLNGILDAALLEQSPKKEHVAALTMVLRLFCNLTGKEQSLPESIIVTVIGRCAGSGSKVTTWFPLLIGLLYNCRHVMNLLDSTKTMALLSSILKDCRECPEVETQMIFTLILGAGVPVPLASTLKKEIECIPVMFGKKELLERLF